MIDRHQAYTTYRPDVCRLVPERARSILDLGCSDGSLGQALKSRCAGREVRGVEFSESLAESAAEKLDQVAVANLDQARASLAAFSGQKFDCIIAADVLEHLVNPETLLKELHPLFFDGGALVVSLPNIRHHSSLYSIFIQGTFPRRSRGIFDDTHLRWFTLRDIKQMLDDTGYVIERVTCTLRVGDQGGGLLNKLAHRLLGPISDFHPIREFMAYQYVLRARPKQPFQL